MASYQYQIPSVHFTRPLKYLLSTVAPLTSISLGTTSATVITQSTLSDLQAATVTQIMQTYRDPDYMTRPIILTNFMGINCSDPMFELDVNGQGNMNAGLSVQQPPGKYNIVRGNFWNFER